MNIDKLWIRSIFAFPLGVAWCCYKEKIDAYLKTKCGVLVFICSSIVLLFSAVLSVYGEYRGIDIILTIGEIVGSSAFCIWLFTLLFKVNFNNKATRFFGKYAMEVYLLHNLFLTVMNRVEFVAKNNALYILCTVIFTAIGAVLLKKINDIVINRLYFKNSVN